MRYFLLHFCFFPFLLCAQNVGIGTSNPDPSAKLDIQSTTGGVLIPRLTTTERNALANPANGLLIFNSIENQFEFFNGLDWNAVGGANSVFKTENDVISTISSVQQSFIIGRDELPENGIDITDTLFLFNHERGALRGGLSTNTQRFSTDSIGFYSFAYGRNNRAVGPYSVALGSSNTTSNLNSAAIGENNVAQGSASLATGTFTKAIGGSSFTGGLETKTTGEYSVALGEFSEAWGNASFSQGYQSFATGLYSIAMGFENTASGQSAISIGTFSNATELGAIAIGSGSDATARSSTALAGGEANGDNSISIGLGTIANSYSAATLGSFNEDITAISNSSWNAEDRLLVIGNGSSTSDRSDAMVVLKNGTTAFPDANLIVGRDKFPNNGELVSGDFLFFNKSRSAFRGGKLSSSPNWSLDSMGTSSFAYGENCKAKGFASIAMGDNSIASQIRSIAIGSLNNANGRISTAIGNRNNANGSTSTCLGVQNDSNGNNSIAIGNSTTSNGFHSVALGSNNTADGNYSTALGYATRAYSYGEFVVGSSNTAYSPNSSLSWDTQDRLFVIGNGSSAAAPDRSDAMVVLKSGKTGIGTSIPGSLFHLKEDGESGFKTVVQVIESITSKRPTLLFAENNYNDDPSQAGMSIEYDGTSFQGNNMMNINKIDGSPIISFRNDGNVGIGTTAASEALEVVGNICYSGSLSACSDRRYKKNFLPINNALASINQLNGLYYHWNTEDFPEKEFTAERQIGVIAQEVEALFPEMVLTDDEGYKSVDYGKLTPVLIEAVKELSLKLSEKESDFDKLQSRVEKLEQLVTASTRLD